MIDAQRLRVLRAVVATGSVSKASSLLRYSPSAVSQQLSALQSETGLRLIERNGRGIHPTAAGRTLSSAAEQVLDRLHEVDQLVTDLRAGRTGSLSITYFASAGTDWIPPVVARLAREFPDLGITLHLAESASAAHSPTDIEVFVKDPATAGAPDAGPPFVVSHMVDDPYLVIVSKAHRLAGAPSVRLSELAAECWVDNDFQGGSCRQIVLDACAAAGFAPSFRIEAPDYRAAVTFVAEGLGISLLPTMGARALPPTVAAVPVVDPTPVRAVLVRVKATVEHQPATVRALELLRRGVAPVTPSPDEGCPVGGHPRS